MHTVIFYTYGQWWSGSVRNEFADAVREAESILRNCIVDRVAVVCGDKTLWEKEKLPATKSWAKDSF